MQWLESFVNNGTTQMQAVARGVEMLCNEIAPQILHNEGASVDEGPSKTVGGLRSDIATIAKGLKAGEQKTAQMQALLAEVAESAKQAGGIQALSKSEKFN